jgi:hypothetical protein
MGRKRGQGNFTPQKKNNSIKDLVENEENEYPVPDPNRMMKNIINKLNDIHKKNLSEEIMEAIMEILMEKLQKMVKENVQDELKQYQDATNKLQKTQK